MERKQTQFDELTEDINRIFMGDITNFYSDDFPEAEVSESQKAELQAAIGDLVTVQELESMADL